MEKEIYSGNAFCPIFANPAYQDIQAAILLRLPLTDLFSLGACNRRLQVSVKNIFTQRIMNGGDPIPYKVVKAVFKGIEERVKVLHIENLTDHQAEKLAKKYSLTCLRQSEGRRRRENRISNRGLRALVQMTVLKQLDLSGCWLITNPMPLVQLTLLEKLDLSDTCITNLTHLTQLPYLKRLNLNGCWLIKDPTPLSQLTRLVHLNLSYCGITKLVALTSLTGLVHLNLTGNDLFTDLTPLRQLTHLTYLNLSQCLNSKDLTALAQLTFLEYLNLNGCWLIEDLTPLSQLTHLTCLNLNGCWKITNFIALRQLSQLTFLNLGRLNRTPQLLALLQLKQLGLQDYLTLAYGFAFGKLASRYHFKRIQLEL